MGRPDPEAYAAQWASAWNDNDLEAIPAHVHDDVVFTSPVAAQRVGGDGALRSKDALVVNYRSQRGGLAREVLRFDGDLVRSGGGT